MILLTLALQSPNSARMLNLLSAFIASAIVLLMGVMIQDVTEIAPSAYRFGWAFVACAVTILFILYFKHSQKQHKDLTDKVDALYEQYIEHLKDQAEK